MNIRPIALSLSLILVAIYCSPYAWPEDKSVEKEGAFDYYLEGIDAYQKGEYMRALDQVKRAIAINKYFAQFYELEGNIFLALDNNEAALKSFFTALNYRSNFSVVLKQIGEIYFKQGNFLDAIQYFNKAFGSDNSDYSIYLDIAACHLALGDYIRADFSLKEHQRLMHQNHGVPGDRYFTLAGETYYYLGNYQESIKMLRQAETTDEVLYLFGRNYYALKDYDAGLSYFNRLMQRDRSNGRWYFYRAIYYYQKCDFTDALSQFKQALVIDPTIYDAHYFIGKIHERNKEYRAAWESFRLFRESMREKDELRYIQEKVVLPDELYMIE
jgi:tetratricopeptide (TPR) repeat protein